MTIAEARDILDRHALAGRVEAELIEAAQVASLVLDDVLHSAVVAYLDEDVLAELLRRAKDAHAEYEAEHGPDPDWPAWYAAWIAKEATR